MPFLLAEILNFQGSIHHIGVGSFSYLINYRLNEAAILLSKTEKKIITISNETGFNNVDYFCRLFKKHYHMTPTEYRKSRTTVTSHTL